MFDFTAITTDLEKTCLLCSCWHPFFHWDKELVLVLSFHTSFTSVISLIFNLSFCCNLLLVVELLDWTMKYWFYSERPSSILLNFSWLVFLFVDGLAGEGAAWSIWTHVLKGINGFLLRSSSKLGTHFILYSALVGHQSGMELIYPIPVCFSLGHALSVT